MDMRPSSATSLLRTGSVIEAQHCDCQAQHCDCQALAAPLQIKFDEETKEAEKSTASNNFALAWFIKVGRQQWPRPLLCV